ncbi:type VI secretion system membrane subunit TssM [Aliivibrio sp. S2TY2]|uniref:type VI secretion system membrane subunit TssM n=1 Tax=unclassified Aliivibrio TaxID=2645654 RepID=UPI002378E6CE|nr:MULTISPECIES: type VI secretion system membrane subunit TssM [unclassified Aliivibrio]MDD9173527.1 type VI secretion system membrane subunit TssM [Aliivibrio sp. S3TY1]MDD9190603.1 type VI secretion system membrane subunit TssM [Aliivibrio sp. S2TY2]
MKSFFNTLLDTLKKTWCWSLLCSLLFALLLCVFGKHIAIANTPLIETTTGKVLTVFICLLLWAAFNLTLWWLAKRESQKEENKEAYEAAQSELAYIQEQSSLLKGKLDAAITTIKRAGLYGKLNNNVKYQLPWYMVIGPQNSGKTTLLECSGLDFPLNQTDGHYTRDIQNSQHCEWYFANHAVLLDAAGRFFDQHENELNKPVWGRFLKALRNKRRRRPLNGVILTIDITTLQSPDESSIEVQARYVRERLQELRHELSSDMPIYFLLTKMDKVEGFEPFFSSLSREEMDQVFGVTFNEGEGQQADKIKQEFEKLILRIDAQVMSRLHDERDVMKRAELLQFPRQLSFLAERLALFSELAFTKTRYHQASHLRGLYLTSVPAPTNAQADSSTSNIGQNLGISSRVLPTYQHQRGFFIRKLLDEVIFPNSELATLDDNYERKVKFKNGAIYAASFALIIGFGSLWATSFLNNHSKQQTLLTLADNYNQQIVHLSPLAPSIELLPTLDPLLKATQVYQKKDNHFPENMAGLQQGEKLRQAAEKAYHQQLIALLLPKVTSELEYQVTNNQDNREFLTPSLRAYLMLNMHEHLDTQYLKQWMGLHWSYLYSGSATEQNALQTHLTNLLSIGFEPVQLNDNLVAKSRKFLRESDTSALVYQQLKQDAKEMNLRDIKLSDHLGPNQNLFNHTSTIIPGLYTQKGYQTVFLSKGLDQVKQLIDENWVIGLSSDLSTNEIRGLYAEVEDLYFHDYIRYWKEAVEQLQIKPSKNIDEAILQIANMTGSSQPILKLLNLIRENTTFVDQAQLASNAAKTTNKLPVNTKLKKVASLGLHSVEERSQSARKAVSNQFEPLNLLLTDKAQATIPLEDALVVVNELSGRLSMVKFSPNPDQSAFKIARDRMQGIPNELNDIRVMSETLPQPLQQWWNQISNNAWGIVLNHSSDHIQMVYHDKVVNHYDIALSGRYPFKNSSHDVNIADFDEFFQNGGILDNFFDAYLSSFVINQKGKFKQKTLHGHSLGLSKSFLNQYKYGLTIQKMFYGSKGKEAKVSFRIAPFELDASALQSTFYYGRNKFSYRHGPIQKKRFTWPITNQRQYVSFVLQDLSGTKVVNQQNSGPWAFFRVLDKFRVNKYRGQDVIKLDLENKGLEAKYLIYSDRTPNPFNRKILSNFYLPKRING